MLWPPERKCLSPKGNLWLKSKGSGHKRTWTVRLMNYSQQSSWSPVAELKEDFSDVDKAYFSALLVQPLSTQAFFHIKNPSRKINWELSPFENIRSINIVLHVTAPDNACNFSFFYPWLTCHLITIPEWKLNHLENDQSLTSLPL